MSTATTEIAVPGTAETLDLAQTPDALASGTLAPTSPPANATAGATDDTTRVFRGRTVEELIPKIQAELGRDAIVIRRQAGLRGGFAGFFQRPYVEIEARRGTPGIDRYDEDDAAPALPSELDEALLADLLARSQPPRTQIPQNASNADANSAPSSGLPYRQSDAHNGHHAPDAPSASSAERDAAVEFLELTATGLRVDADRDDDAEFGGAFKAALAEAEAATNPPPASAPDAAATSSQGAAASQVSRSRARDAIAGRLLDVGVGEQFVRELLEAATAHVMPLAPARTSLSCAVKMALQQRIPVPRPLPAGNATIVVVGAGGSGKTSCCAALLGAYRKRSALPAACVTIAEGAQRGALELLLSPHVPQPVPVSDPQAVAALLAAREEGVVLVDTPAVSPADRSGIRALGALLADMRADRVVLALPATLGAKPAAQLLEALRPLNVDTVAITHTDETDQLGVAVDVACNAGLAPVYTLERGRGTGLAGVDPSELAERLLGGK